MCTIPDLPWNFDDALFYLINWFCNLVDDWPRDQNIISKPTLQILCSLKTETETKVASQSQAAEKFF